MAAPKKAAKRTTRSSAPASIVEPDAGEPVGAWAEILAEARKTPGVAIEPFEITKDLVLQPLTPLRARKLAAANQAYMLALAVVARAAQTGSTQEEAELIQQRVDESLTAYNEALFGEDEYPKVQAYFDGRPAWQQELFAEAIKRQFLKLPDEDGSCPYCKVNHTEAERRIEALEQALRDAAPKHDLVAEDGDNGAQVGKGSESSTTSSTTGANSSETSPQSSTESTPTTGPEEHDPGHSSSSTPTLSPA